MDQPRGRSPSAGQRTHISRQPSPSPHGAFQNNSIAGLGFDPALSSNSPANFAVSTAGFDNAQFLATSQAQQFPHQTSLDQGFLQASQSLSQHNTPHFGPQGSTLQPDALDLTGSANNSNPDFSNFFANNDIGQTQQVPQYLGATLDPQLLDSQPQQHQAVNPNDLMNQMATTQAHSPTPPHLLPTMNNHQSPSPHASPNMNQGGFPSPGHSRHASLDPSAAFGTGQGSEWGNMASFRGHRRAPSETFSDVSSAHASPYLIQQDSFEDTQPSPMLNPQADPQLFHDPLTQLGQLNFDESRSGISPGHSPGPSPRLPPSQQALPAFQPGNFGLDQGSMNNHFGQPGMMSYSNSGPEPFPVLNHPIGDIGQADAMSPPEINIDFAPPSRQPSFEPSKPEHQADALSPPDRSRSRNRMRAKSDPFSGASSRASTPGSEINRSLSPSAAKSRSPSPSKSSRRSSTSSMPNRDYILDLADPTRPAPADGSNPKRTQKHPATFHCTLCTKRFTRAYNLRSHLRTHTDERPFVCSVCGKAFARQHDRKRHEGLHSGEKKFVCRGNLKDGNNWGCGRRFARADALGRHFRSEAGRVCIRPLLEEEAAEKGNWDGQNQQMNNGNGMFGQMSQQNFNGGMMAQPNFEPFPQGGMAQAPHQFLPAAILAQYPALAGLQWDQLPPGPPEEVEGDISGRSSFDASSGGEYYDEEGDNYQNPQQQPMYAGNDGGWASDSGYH